MAGRPPLLADRAPTERERGVALLTVLMLVAVIAVLAGAALERLHLATRTAGNAVAIEQARAGARMAEVLATTRIDDLLGRDPNRVTLQGGWSGRPLPLPLAEGGAAVARVSDGGNCFNLNGLVTQATTGAYVDYPAARLALARLIRLVGGTDGDAVAAATADWIDSDGDQQPGGAEDPAYLGLPQPYRTAGTLMADPSELRAVSGVTPDLYARLRPLLCTLPVAAPARLNVNTLAPEQAPLIAAWLPEGTSAAGVAQALLRRPPDGFATTAAFWASPSLAGVSSGNAAAQTAVTSTWFALRVDVRRGDTAVEQHGLIDATHLPARVVARQWGEAS
jgi:general secretion pathway protein K